MKIYAPIVLIIVAIVSGVYLYTTKTNTHVEQKDIPVQNTVAEVDNENPILNTAVFSSATMDEKNIFKKLIHTGSSQYTGALFQLNSVSAFESVLKDEDGTGARVSSFISPGSEGFSGGIVMVGPGSRFSVGVVVYDAEWGMKRLHYYTNVPELKRVLPKTIANWSTQFKDLDVVYESQ